MTVRLTAVCAIAQLGAAIWVRGLRPELPPPPEPPDERAALSEPMQFLLRGGAVRADELTRFVAVDSTLAWESHSRDVFELGGCPELREWLDTQRGQAVAQLIADLRRGSREEALAGLALVFQLARSTRWRPGLFGGDAAAAERLGGLLEDWLRTWARPAATDSLLYEPALAAVALYGRALRTAWDAPAIGNQEAALQRAVAFLDELCGARTPTRTAFGDALHARHPHAFLQLARTDDPLLGLEDEAQLSFPDLDGSCAE